MSYTHTLNQNQVIKNFFNKPKKKKSKKERTIQKERPVLEQRLARG